MNILHGEVIAAPLAQVDCLTDYLPGHQLELTAAERFPDTIREMIVYPAGRSEAAAILRTFRFVDPHRYRWEEFFVHPFFNNLLIGMIEQSELNVMSIKVEVAIPYQHRGIGNTIFRNRGEIARQMWADLPSFQHNHNADIVFCDLLMPDGQRHLAGGSVEAALQRNVLPVGPAVAVHRPIDDNFETLPGIMDCRHCRRLIRMRATPEEVQQAVTYGIRNSGLAIADVALATKSAQSLLARHLILDY